MKKIGASEEEGENVRFKTQNLYLLNIAIVTKAFSTKKGAHLAPFCKKINIKLIYNTTYKSIFVDRF